MLMPYRTTRTAQLASAGHVQKARRRARRARQRRVELARVAEIRPAVPVDEDDSSRSPSRRARTTWRRRRIRRPRTVGVHPRRAGRRGVRGRSVGPDMDPRGPRRRARAARGARRADRCRRRLMRLANTVMCAWHDLARPPHAVVHLLEAAHRRHVAPFLGLAAEVALKGRVLVGESERHLELRRLLRELGLGPSRVDRRRESDDKVVVAGHHDRHAGRRSPDPWRARRASSATVSS